LVPSADDTLVFADEYAFLKEDEQDDNPRSSFRTTAGYKESFLLSHSEDFNDDIASSILEFIRSWKVYHFHDTSTTAKVRKLCNINDNTYLRENASNLSAYLYMLKERYKGHYKNIVDTIRLVSPFFDDFLLAPSRLNPEMINLEWKQKGSDAYFDATSLSDGTMRFICLATLLLQPELPGVLLIDEPELGLHPYVLTVLAELLKLASEKAQIIVGTQSVTLVNQFAPEDVLVVEMEGNETVMKRLSSGDLSDWLEDYTLGELWEKNVFGGRPK
jgi:predicted ATPase